MRAEQDGGATVSGAASAAAGQRFSLRLWIPRMSTPLESLFCFVFFFLGGGGRGLSNGVGTRVEGAAGQSFP